MKKLLFVVALVSGVLLTVGQSCSFASLVFQFDEKGLFSLSNNGAAVAGVTQTTGAFDSMGGGTLAYTLPVNYTFALAIGVNQYGVLVTDSSSAVSDLLIFQNSGNQGQVVIYDSPAAAAAEAGNGDLAKGYLTPMQGGVPYTDVNYPTPQPNSPAYMQLALTHLFSNFAVNTVAETSVNGGSLSGFGAELIGGDSTIKVSGTGTTCYLYFVSEVPEPSTFMFLAAGLALMFGAHTFRKRRQSPTA
jgi:hypothetical protein